MKSRICIIVFSSLTAACASFAGTETNSVRGLALTNIGGISADIPPPGLTTNTGEPLGTTNPKLSPGDLEKLDAYLRDYLSKHRIPGVAVSVVQGTNLIFSKGYGEGITAQTPFQLASVSKSFTALAIMQLVEAGKLDLESPVTRYLPWFRTADAEASGKITLQHLLHHLSGISTMDGRRGCTGNDGVNVESRARSYRHMHLTARPGSRFEYSNCNYVILGAVVEAASGMTFDDYIRANIFEPLKMHSSYVSNAEAVKHGLMGHRYWFGHPVAYPADDDCPGDIPAGGLISSAEDLSHYTTALMNGGRFQERSILSPAGVDILFKKYGNGAEPGYYAMGWEVNDPGGRGVKVISHEGAAPEFYSLVRFLPEQKLGITFLADVISYTGLEPFQLANDFTLLLLAKPPQNLRVNWTVAGATWLVLLLPFLQGIGLWRTLRLLRKWRAGHELEATFHDWVRYWCLPLLGHATVAAVTLWLLPWCFDLTLPRLMVFVPDYGTLAALSGGFAILWGITRSTLVGSFLLQFSNQKSHT